MTLLYCGIAPSEIREMPVSDLLTFMEALPAIAETSHGRRYDV